MMILSDPILRDHVTVIKPHRGRPSTIIEVVHPGGEISTIIGLPSTPAAGHGETATVVVLDEFARQEYASETFKAILPTVSGGGNVVVVSTANGVGSLEQDAGTSFYYLYHNANDIGFSKRFLGWKTHPERDKAWFSREAMALAPNDRSEQYPDNEEEAFILTGDIYFDADAISWYGKEGEAKSSLGGEYSAKGDFRAGAGWVSIYSEPEENHLYAMGCDCATGRGGSFNAATVVDLETLEIASEIHGKMDADRYVDQIYWIGKKYNWARVAVEMAGGFGETVVILLRKDTDGRPSYPMLYRHRESNRVDLPERKSWGFPMNAKMRSLCLGYLEKLIRQRAIPKLPMGTIMELRTFVRKSSGTSPRAQDGCNDDRVMSLALTCEMFRRFGAHSDPKPKKARSSLHRDFPPGSPEWEVPFSRRYG